MPIIKTPRSITIDLLKAIAIIAVILYHADIFQYGYLGVDVFFVIAGFLTTKSILQKYQKQTFCYLQFESNRLYRLWPLTVLLCIIVFLVGYFWFLPFNLKDSAEQTVGSVFFGNNLIQYITSGNYWDLNNLNKPLMHLWYLGVLMQFYVLFPIIFISAYQFKDKAYSLHLILVIVFLGSLVCYLMPTTSDEFDFYFLPSRLFEFAAGALLVSPVKKANFSNFYYFLSFIILAILLCLNKNIEIKQFRLLVIVALVCLVIDKFSTSNILNLNKGAKSIAYLGKASFSLFLVHQPILALYRYFMGELNTVSSFVIVLTICFGIGLLTYKYLEKGLSRFVKYEKPILLSCFVVAVILAIPSTYIYKHEGVVRDVPQLNIYVINPMSYETQDYNSRNTSYNRDFPKNGKKNVLVIGDSFGRDWINVLRESHVETKVNISYYTITKPNEKILNDRITLADVIFISSNNPLDNYLTYFPRITKKKYWVIGAKNFAQCGPYYVRFMNQNFQMMKTYESSRNKNLNNSWRITFENNYIDLLAVIRKKDGSIPMFTPNGKFFSHDAIHLTQAGAKYIAHHLDVEKYL